MSSLNIFHYCFYRKIHLCCLPSLSLNLFFTFLDHTDFILFLSQDPLNESRDVTQKLKKNRIGNEMIRREKKICEFPLIISLESLINQSVWEWDGVLSVTMVLSLMQGLYLPILSSCCSDDFLFTPQATGIAGLLFAGVFCSGGMELARSVGSFVACETGSDDQSVSVAGFATGSSGFLGRASRSLSGKRSVLVLLLLMFSSIVT